MTCFVEFGPQLGGGGSGGTGGGTWRHHGGCVEVKQLRVELVTVE
jgi:hypothetical protein